MNISDDPHRHEYKEMLEEWEADGCQPPDEAEFMLQKLGEDAAQGKISKDERLRIISNTLVAHQLGTIDKDNCDRVLRALNADENGNLSDV